MKSNVLTLQNLTIGYAGVDLVHSINADVQSGEFVVVLGKNGVGKSTLMQNILGQEKVRTGTIRVNDQNLKSLSSQKIAQHIAVVYSKLNIVPSIRVIDILKTGRIAHSSFIQFIQSKEEKRIEEILTLVGIKDLKNSFLNELSEGQIQLVMMARALMQDTPVLILDEPTANLDLENQIRVFQLIQRLKEQTGKSIIMITHEAQLGLTFADKIWWIEDQQLHQGLPESMAYHHQIIQKLSGNFLSFNALTENYEIVSKSKFKSSFQLVNDLAYWLHQALNRLGIELSSSILNQLSFTNDKIILAHHTFESIDSFLNYIQQHEEYYNNRSK